MSNENFKHNIYVRKRELETKIFNLKSQKNIDNGL